MAQRRPSLLGSSSTWLLALCVLSAVIEPVLAQNIDGGRSELPGMKQDIFDQVQRNKKAGNQPRGKGPPECPKSDGMSPFLSMAFASNDIFVRLNSSEGKCERLVSVGGANYSTLINASRTCGPPGEWKKRIAENMSSVFFQGGLDWVKHDNETIEIVLESGTFMVEVSEHKYEQMVACWSYACGCDQANSPITRIFFYTLFAIAVGGLGYDSFKVLWAKIVGKKPPKHVMCKHCKTNKMVEVKLASKHLCDLCAARGTTYRCSKGTACNYDMCKACYTSERKKVKAEWKKWIAKHPEDADKKDKKKKDDKSDDDEDNEKVSEKSENEEQSGMSTKDTEESGKEDEAESKAEEPEEQKEKEDDNESPKKGEGDE